MYKIHRRLCMDHRYTIYAHVVHEIHTKVLQNKPIIVQKITRGQQKSSSRSEKWDITNVWMALLFGNVEHGLSFFHLRKYQNVLCYHFYTWNSIEICAIYIFVKYTLKKITWYLKSNFTIIEKGYIRLSSRKTTYSFNSAKTWAMFCWFDSRIIISSFSSFT